MIYKTNRFSPIPAKPKKHICCGRPAAVYFSNEKELIRWLAIAFLSSWLLLSAGALGAVRSALYGSPSSLENRRSEIRVDEGNVQSLHPGYDPAFGPSRGTNLVTEQAEQNAQAVAQNVEQQLWPDYGDYNDTYQGQSAFWSDDIISNFFANIGQLLGKWITDGLSDWRVVFGLAALFALDTSLRSLVCLPARQSKLKTNPAKAHRNTLLSFNLRAWRNWTNRSWWYP